MRSTRKCGRCGSRDTHKGRRVEGYGSVCEGCVRVCSFPAEQAAVGIAAFTSALATGMLKLRPGFHSYASIRQMHEQGRREQADLRQKAIDNNPLVVDLRRRLAKPHLATRYRLFIERRLNSLINELKGRE
jgi:hypothetical protein